MHLYTKGWLFTGWVLVVFVTFPWWITALRAALGNVGLVLGLLLWLSHGVIMLRLFRCPECGLSPFVSNRGFLAWSTPWPRKICGECGHDHKTN